MKIRNAYSLQVVGALWIFWYRDESVRMLLTAKAKELGRPALTPVASKSSSKATVTAKTTSEIDLQTYQELQATIAKLQGDLNDRGKQLETQAIAQQQLIDDNSKALKQLGDARKRAESLGAGAKSAKDEVDRLTKDVKQLKQQAKDWQAIGEAKESKLVEAMSKANIVAGEMSGLQAKQEKMEKVRLRLTFISCLHRLGTTGYQALLVQPALQLNRQPLLGPRGCQAQHRSPPRKALSRRPRPEPHQSMQMARRRRPNRAALRLP